MISSRPRAEVPDWVISLINGNIITKMEYEGDTVIYRINLRAFFEKVLEGTGIELVEITDKHAVLKMRFDLNA